MGIYVYGAVAIAVAGLLVTYYVRGVQLDAAKVEIEQLEVKQVVLEKVTVVREFESNQTIELYKQKAVAHEEVNTSIGNHTISF